MKIKSLKEYLDEKGKLASPKTDLIADFNGTSPKAPEKADSSNLGMKAPKQSSPANYKAANNNISPIKGDKGLSDLGDKSLVYEPGNADTAEGKEIKTWPKNEALSPSGERSFQTYQAWKAAVKKINPNAKFDGDKDICTAPGVGEWDGERGVIYKQKTTVSEFVESTKNMTASEFAKHMIEECGCNVDEEIPQVTAYAAGKFHPHPPEAIRYIVSLAGKNPRILESLIYELKNQGLLGDMIQSTMDNHPESYDQISGLLGDESEGPGRVRSLIKSMDDDHSDFHKKQDDMYESVDSPVGFSDDSEDASSDLGSLPDGSDQEEPVLPSEPKKEPKKLKKKFPEDHLLDAMASHPRMAEKMKGY